MTLHHLRALILHIVAQIIETKFVIGRIGNVAGISRAAFVLRNIRHDYAGGQPEKAIYPAHPFGIATCQIVVHGDNMDTFALQRIQITSQSFRKCLAFPSAHFGNFAAVQNKTPNHLHIEMPHAHDAFGSFTNRRKGFRQDVVERFACLQTISENLRLSLQPFIVESFNFGFEFVNLGYDLHHRFDVTIIRRAE